MPLCNYATVSPDGRWVAASSWGGPDVKVWELPGGREALHLTNGMAALSFTADGHGLIISASDRNEFLEVGTWRTVFRVLKERAALPGLAVSPDSRWVALRLPSHQVQLCEAPALNPILAVEAVSEWPVRFSPDNSFLLTRRRTGQFCLWNLRLVREELTPLGLGW